MILTSRFKTKVKQVNKVKLNTILIVSVFTFLLTACEVDNTDHPNYGKITSLTVDWSNRGSGIDIPSSYSVRIGDYSTTLSGAVNSIENLFPPGRYTIYVYNTASGITLNGIIATADYGIQGGLGWFFTGRKDILIDRDTEHSFIVEMHQQVRQLRLELEATGDARDRLIGVDGVLSGVARTINIDTGAPIGTTTTTALTFTRADNKFTSDIRLLGIAGNSQTLSLTLHFADGNPASYTVINDLSSRLSTFNTDKRTPMTLSSILVVTPTQAGFTTEISDWIPGGISTGVAD